MIRQILTYGLILLVTSFSCQSLVIYSVFKINQTKVTEEYCVNKNNPKKPNCHGRCHLSKELAKSSQEKEDPQHQIEKKTTLFVISISSTHIQAVDLISNVHVLSNWETPKLECPTKVFHPPKI